MNIKKTRFRFRIVAFAALSLSLSWQTLTAQVVTQTLFQENFENLTLGAQSNGYQFGNNAFYQIPHTPPSQPAVINPVNGIYTTSYNNPCGAKKLGPASGTRWYYCNIFDYKIFETMPLAYSGASTPASGGNYTGTVSFKYSSAIVGITSIVTGLNFYVKVTNTAGMIYQSANITVANGCDDSWRTATINFTSTVPNVTVGLYSVNGESNTGNEIRLDDIKVTMDGMPTSPLTNGGTIGYDQNGCGTFDPANLVSATDPSGGSGSAVILYRWKANGTIVPGATSSSLDPGPITATTTYIREAQRTGTSTWVASNMVTVTVGACGIDFALNMESGSSILLAPGETTILNVYVEDLSSTTSNYSIALTKPGAASGLVVSFPAASPWTITTTTSQFILTSNAPLSGNAAITIPVTITRNGGASGNFTFGGTITVIGDSNAANNNAVTTISKL